MSMLLRTTPLRAARTFAPAARQQVRSVHFENTVNHTIPTNVTNKPWLAAKMMIFTTVGFGAPFFLAWWQLQKAQTS